MDTSRPRCYSTTMTLYVNGAFQETAAVAYSPFTCPSGCHAAIGDNGEYLTRLPSTGVADSDPYKGYLDDLRIYNRALSAQEIQDIYNGT